jgi:tetratricopeptide (TPR) repeat protein
VKRVAVLVASLALLFGTLYYLTRIRGEQPPDVRLGFYPPAPVVRALSADQYHFLSQVILLNCVFSYGSAIERRQAPNWGRLYEALSISARLDPYNMDAYYLTQAIFPWEAPLVKPTIDLLEYGFAHRHWDWYLPLFLSFDYAYFLRDYEKAGYYMAKAAALNPKAGYFFTLSARYFYEAGRTAFAIAYLRQLIATERNEQLRQMMITRANALEAILTLEHAVSAFQDRYHRMPKGLEEVQRAGFIDRIPLDPYGGTFYLDAQGRVRTTSKLAKAYKE